MQILVGDIDAVEFDFSAAILLQRFISALAEGVPGSPDGIDFAFRVFGQNCADLVGGIPLHVRRHRANRLQLFDIRVLFLQFLIRRLTTLHRRETGDPQLDNIGLAVEIFRQLAEGEIGQGGIVLLGDGYAWDLAVNGGIKHRHLNPGIHRLLHQRGRIRITPLRENNPVIFLADRLIHKVLEFCVVTIA